MISRNMDCIFHVPVMLVTGEPLGSQIIPSFQLIAFQLHIFVNSTEYITVCVILHQDVLNITKWLKASYSDKALIPTSGHV